jgi:hypothetical protein
MAIRHPFPTLAAMNTTAACPSPDVGSLSENGEFVKNFRH